MHWRPKGLWRLHPFGMCGNGSSNALLDSEAIGLQDQVLSDYTERPEHPCVVTIIDSLGWLLQAHSETCYRIKRHFFHKDFKRTFLRGKATHLQLRMKLWGLGFAFKFYVFTCVSLCTVYPRNISPDASKPSDHRVVLTCEKPFGMKAKHNCSIFNLHQV